MNKKHTPNRPKLLFFFLFLSILTLFTEGAADAAGLRLIYTNDNLGELDGCG